MWTLSIIYFSKLSLQVAVKPLGCKVLNFAI